MTKLSNETISLIHEYAEAGMKSRAIARALNVSKSSVNNHIAAAKYFESKPELKKQPKILLFDLETSAALAYTFGRFNLNLSQDNIHTEGGVILCASYKWLGEGETKVLYNKSDIARNEDGHVVAQLWELIESADAIIAHNGLSFDWKMLQARCLVNHFAPLPSVKIIDTLQMAKKNFRLPSNKLDSIAKLLGIGEKQSTGGIGLWKKVQQGDEEALSTMLEYCKHDTELLEEVYFRLRSFGLASNFNAAHYHEDDKERCPVCGSDEVHSTGRSVFTDLSEFEEKRCMNCDSIHRTRKAKNTKEKRKSLLAGVKN